jgi:hypothetical protein
LVRSPATPDQDKKQNFKKGQNRTMFVFGIFWFARRPHPGARQNAKRQKGSKSYNVCFWDFLVRSPATPRSKKKYKTSKRLKIVQSLILGFLGSLDGHTRIKIKCKTSKRLKNVQSSFLGFLGWLDGHPG